MYNKIFQFGQKITATDYFSDIKGYGFVHPGQVFGKTMSEQSIYSGGWNLENGKMKEWEHCLVTKKSGVSIAIDNYVMIFKIIVPHNGCYQITLKSCTDENAIEGMSIFVGRRNLVERNISIAPHATYTRTFFTYVSSYIPAMTSIPCNENAIYVSLAGKNASLSELYIEEKNVPTIFVAGDSTLTDQNATYPYYPCNSCTGWAQLLTSYLNSAAVCNQAHSGMTTNCFRDDGHWNILKQNIKPDDYVVLQFGHNDQKRRNLRPFGGYLNNLRWYCSEIKKVGAFPIIVSPISRVPIKDNDTYYSLLSDYAMACKKAAQECHVPFVDLHSLSFKYLCNHYDTAAQYFMPGDITHTNEYGAELFASFFISEIEKQIIQPSSTWNIKKDRKILSDTKTLSRTKSGSSIAPQIDIPYLDIANIPEYEDMKLALQKGLLDPCVMFLHPTAPMPRAQFLMVFLKALRLSGTRPYMGYYCDLSYDEWDSSYLQTCLDTYLIDETTTPNRYFRPDEDLTFEEYASFLIRSMENKLESRKGITLETSFNKALALKLIPANCIADSPISRALCYQGLVHLMDLLDTSTKALPKDAEIHPVG